MTEESILIPTAQAAAMIGVSTRTWYAWDLLGAIPQPVRINRKLFWRRDELLAWIDANCPKRKDWNFRPKKP